MNLSSRALTDTLEENVLCRGLNFRQNLSIDQFAHLVLQFVNQEQIGLYSIVAHSQGGMVGTHLLAYYQTSMDAMVSLINVWMIFNSV